MPAVATKEMPGQWQPIMSNYAEISPAPGEMTLRPFEAVWWLQSDD
jgi:trehalose-6-phosphate hydrolase